MLLVWVAWSFLFPVNIHKTATSGRLERTASPVPIIAPSSGYIKFSRLDVGEYRLKDAILLRYVDHQELQESRQIELQIEQLIRQAVLKKKEISSAEAASAANRQNLILQQTQTGQALQHAIEQASLQQQIVRSMERSGVESQLDLFTQKLRSKELTATVDRLQHDLDRHPSLIEQFNQSAASRRFRLQSELAGLNGRLVEAQQQAVRQQQILADLNIVAPLAGELAEALTLNQNEWITAGTTLATLLPAGDLRFIAYFDPADVYGHVDEGQMAEIQLAGFPWQQYGSLIGRVIQVDRARRAGQVRVVLQLVEPLPPVPLQHGMPGLASIRTEQATPVQLLLRAIDFTVQR